MNDRYDFVLDGSARCTDEMRALPPVGATVVFGDGVEAVVERIVYPVARRVVLECKSVEKPEPKKVAEPPKPQEEPAEEAAAEEKKETPAPSRRSRN